MPRYIDADRFKSNLEKAMEKMHLIGGVKCVDIGAVIQALDRQPTADVAPKSEVERLEHLRAELSKEVVELQERISEMSKRQLPSYYRACSEEEAINIGREYGKTEVARKICCEIEEEIVAALESNYRALKAYDCERIGNSFYELVSSIKGKIDALRGIEGFVEEIKKKYTEDQI